MSSALSICALIAGAAILLSAPPAVADSLEQDLVVAEDPVDFTPNILDGHVEAITTVGDRVFVGGTFTQVKQVGDPTTYTRNYLFAFDRNTGALDTAFVPQLDGAVWALAPAPDGSSVIVGGAFATVNGVSNFGVARLDAADGSMASGFSAATAGKVRDLAVHGNTVYLGGDIWSVNGVPRTRLAAIDATTGQLDPTVAIGPTTPRVSVDWISELDVSPDGSTLMVVGNFVEFAGEPRKQIAMIDLTGPQAVLADWSTERFAPVCIASFWTYLRDVQFSPDGGYFVVATTGFRDLTEPDLCDSASRWESATRGSDLLETWADWTSGDTLTAVAISDVAVYVGGHQRWLNGCEDTSACDPKLRRDGIGALDPQNGVPLSWNPTKDRGEAVWDLHLSARGLYVGSDTDFAGGEYHAKLAQFPLAGGTPVPVVDPVVLPSGLYSGRGQDLTTRAFDGATFGTDATVAVNVIDYDSVEGTFQQLDTLYYVDTASGDLKARPFDGFTMGAASTVWDQTDLSTVTAAGYLDGRLYTTRAGSPELFYNYFAAESAIVGSGLFVVSGNGDGLDWSTTDAMAFADGALYYTTQSGDLFVISMDATGAPIPGSQLLISGPGLDGRDWTGADLFFLSADAAPTVSLLAPTDGETVAGLVVLSAEASDDLGVDRVEFVVDGISVGVDSDGGDGWSVSWDSTTQPDGTDVVVTAAAFDGAAQSSQASVTITVDNLGAAISLAAPLAGATVSGSAVGLAADATDAIGVAQVEFFADATSLGIDTDGGDGWTVLWDSTTATDGPIELRAAATDTFGRTTEDTITVTVANGSAGVVVMVVADGGSLGTGDAAVRDRLVANGFDVTLLSDENASPAAAAGASMVLVSSSANSFLVGNSFAGVPEPVWTAKPWLFDDMGLTGTISGADFGTTSAASIDIVNDTHPLAAGMTGAVSVTTASRSISFGTPAVDADVVAVVGGLPTTFVYEPGDTLADGSPAAGCRLTSSIFQSAPTVFTDDGWALFDAAAAYVANGCVPVPVNDPPMVAITDPLDGTVVAGSTVTVAATVTDDDGVSQVEFLANGSSLGIDFDGGDGWSLTWDTTGSADGATTLEAVATDGLGKTGSAAIALTVDNLGPSVALTAPVDGATVAGTAVAVTADATDAVAVASVEFFANGASLGIDTDGANGWSVTWDSTAAPDGPVTVQAAATDTSGFTAVATVAVTVDNAGPGIVVMVVGNPGSLSSGDTSVKARLESLGFTVTVVDDNGVTVGVGAGASFVLVSSTVSGSQVGGAFVAADYPVWMAKPWLLDDMGMTGTQPGTDFGTTSASTVTITDPAHPLAAGLAGDVTITTGDKNMSWGVPGGDGVVVATSNGLPTVLVYDAGDALADGSPAAGCRVAFSVFQSAPTVFTDDGWTMFDAATAYLAGGCG